MSLQNSECMRTICYIREIFIHLRTSCAHFGFRQ